jgi:hypothetical protein
MKAVSRQYAYQIPANKNKFFPAYYQQIAAFMGSCARQGLAGYSGIACSVICKKRHVMSFFLFC